MSDGGDSWIDEEAGPLVRPYAMTRGRTRPANTDLDLITVVFSTRAESETLALEADYVAILELCQRPLSVAEVAAHLAVPVVVVKVLLSDLVEWGEIIPQHPLRTTQTPDRNLLQAVLDGVRRL